MKKFPKTVFVAWDEADEPYLMVATVYDAFAEIGSVVPVGVYELKRTINVTAKAEAK